MDRSKFFANFALLVSGVAVLTSFGVWFVDRALTLPLQISLALIVIGLALFVYFDPDRARAMFSGRQARYGSNAFVLFAAFLGILIVVNFLVFENAQDWGLRWDLTEDQERTLSPETIRTLESLESPVVVRAFYTARNVVGQERAKALLDDFQFFSKGNFVYEIINPEEEPLAAQQEGITQDGTLVFSLGEFRERVTVISELEFTSAILRLLTPGDKGIYFLAGHGEFSLGQTGETSLGQLARSLGEKNYTVEALNLLVDPAVPPDALVVVIAGPLQPLTEPEMEILRAYVQGGGALIVAQEAPAFTDFGSAVDPISQYLLDEWGIELGNDIVVDLQAIQIFNSPFIAISAQYGAQAITSDLLQRQLATIFPVARSVNIVNDQIPGVVQTSLIQTSDQSWAETNFESVNDNTLNPDEEDPIGPISLAVAAENENGGRVVVFGDAEFLTDGAITQFGNRDLALNAVDWAAEQEQLITLTPKNFTQRFIIPPSGAMINLIGLGTVFVIPGLVLIAGLVVWAGRRRRG